MTPPLCDTLTEPACLLLQVPGLVQSATASAAGDVLTSISSAISDGVHWIVVNTATLWIAIPSPGLTSDPAISQLQAWLLPVTAAIAAGSVIAAGARMAITRRAIPLLDVTGGLVTIAAVATLGVADRPGHSQGERPSQPQQRATTRARPATARQASKAGQQRPPAPDQPPRTC
jgi:hypothetical protein